MKKKTTNPVGRPRVSEPRRNRVSIQYTDAEFAALEQRANGTPLPEFVRIKSLEQL